MVQRNEQARILSNPAAAHRPLNAEASSWTFQTVWTSRWSASQSRQLYTDFPCCGSWTTEPSGFWGTEIRKYSVSLSVRSLVMALAEKLTNCAAVSGQFQQVSIWSTRVLFGVRIRAYKKYVRDAVGLGANQQGQPRTLKGLGKYEEVGFLGVYDKDILQERPSTPRYTAMFGR